MLAHENGPLVVKGEIVVDGAKFPHLRRALERGQAACAVGQKKETTNNEDAMAKKKSSGKKSQKSQAKTKPESRAASAKAPKERDPRIPAPGGVIQRDYKGKKLEVKVLEQGFEFEGETFTSLTALALKVTGAKAISGPAFFKLTESKPVEAK